MQSMRCLLHGLLTMLSDCAWSLRVLGHWILLIIPKETCMIFLGVSKPAILLLLWIFAHGICVSCHLFKIQSVGVTTPWVTYSSFSGDLQKRTWRRPPANQLGGYTDDQILPLSSYLISALPTNSGSVSKCCMLKGLTCPHLGATYLDSPTRTDLWPL